MPAAHRLYIGTIGEGLFRSTDGGDSFRRTCDGMFVECHVRALAFDPRDARVLFLGSEQGLFRSADGADSWTRVESPLNGLQIWSILLLPHAPDVLLVGTCPSRLFRSADGGRTWTEPPVQIEPHCPRIMHTRVTTLLADPTEPGTVWAGIEIDGLRISRDSGQTWQAVGQGLSSRDIHALVSVPPISPRPAGGEGSGVRGLTQRLLASTNNDLNASADGQTWQPLGVGRVLPWPYCRALAQKCDEPQVVLLGNGDAPPGSVGLIARSTDGGLTWQPARMPGRANSTIWNFAVHAADPQLMYASSVSGQVYRSTDGGLSWEKLPREFGEIRALAWTPA